jgi:hypothetical protein
MKCESSTPFCEWIHATQGVAMLGKTDKTDKVNDTSAALTTNWRPPRPFTMAPLMIGLGQPSPSRVT